MLVWRLLLVVFFSSNAYWCGGEKGFRTVGEWLMAHFFCLMIFACVCEQLKGYSSGLLLCESDEG